LTFGFDFHILVLEEDSTPVNKRKSDDDGDNRLKLSKQPKLEERGMVSVFFQGKIHQVAVPKPNVVVPKPNVAVPKPNVTVTTQPKPNVAVTTQPKQLDLKFEQKFEQISAQLKESNTSVTPPRKVIVKPRKKAAKKTEDEKVSSQQQSMIHKVMTHQGTSVELDQLEDVDNSSDLSPEEV
jgi:hypothetical protein